MTLRFGCALGKNMSNTLVEPSFALARWLGIAQHHRIGASYIYELYDRQTPGCRIIPGGSLRALGRAERMAVVVHALPGSILPRRRGARASCCTERCAVSPMAAQTVWQLRPSTPRVRPSISNLRQHAIRNLAAFRSFFLLQIILQSRRS